MTDRVLKVFVSGEDQDKFAESHSILERYKGFVLLKTSARSARAVARRYLVEDISDQYRVRVRGRTLRPSRRPPLPDGRRHHYLVQFIGPIKPSWMAAVRRTGAEPREPFGGFTWVVRANAGMVSRILELPYVLGLCHLPHRDRIAVKTELRAAQRPSARGARQASVFEDIYIVTFFGEDDLKKAMPQVKRLGFKVRDRVRNLLVAALPAGRTARSSPIKALATVHGVRDIRQRSRNRPRNNVAPRFMGLTRATANPGPGLRGSGEVVAVCDTGLDIGKAPWIHPDFAGRVQRIKSYPIAAGLGQDVRNPGADDGAADRDSGHGTHVAGSIVGSGASSAGMRRPIHGVAPRAQLVFQAIEQEAQWKTLKLLKENGRYGLWGLPDDLGEIFRDAYREGARIHSNSWGGGDFGDYDAQCAQLDRFVWRHPDFCVLAAAGNDSAWKRGATTMGTVTAPATAKNCITVGACESLRREFSTETYGSRWEDDFRDGPYWNDPVAGDPGQVVAFSSRGPTSDGRLKPDVVAPGTFILSTRSTRLSSCEKGWAAFPSNPMYFYLGGTSMATPLTAGVVALLREHLRRRGRRNPSAALLKAALVASARRLGTSTSRMAIVDNDQGFGRVDLDAVVAPRPPVKARFVDARKGLETGDIWTLELNVKSGRRPLRVALAYSDYPGPSLINNLNLIVTPPRGRPRVGNNRRPTFDVQNNVEAVRVNRPRPGRWRIAVVGANVPRGPQPFAVVILGAQ